jgi:thiosulfate/3-mercaptopyruvate sulfurtransferase
MVDSTESRLLSCEWLADHLDDPGVRVIEVTSSPAGESYRQGHIPGAVWWYWKDALWHQSDREFAKPAEMAERLSGIGVGPDTTVVLYGEPHQYGTYALWVMQMAGHKRLRLLDGGRKRWVAEGRPLTTDTPRYSVVPYPASEADASTRVGRDDVLAHIGDSSRLLLDVRSPEEYRGERVSPPPGFDHGAERVGRIPGARHLFFRDLLNDDDTFLSKDEILAKVRQAGVPGDDGREIVMYCRLSHRATLAWFALTELAGLDGVRIYDGSWTEWGSIVGFPIER